MTTTMPPKPWFGDFYTCFDPTRPYELHGTISSVVVGPTLPIVSNVQRKPSSRIALNICAAGLCHSLEHSAMPYGMVDYTHTFRKNSPVGTVTNK